MAASVGSAVSLPIELYKTFHTLNKMDADIMTRIVNVTSQLEELQAQSEQEFQDYPDQTIFDLYHRPLRRDERGVYRLGFEDVPRLEGNHTEMDPTYFNIPGIPPEIEEVERIMRMTTAPPPTTSTMMTSTTTTMPVSTTMITPAALTITGNRMEWESTQQPANSNATLSPFVPTNQRDPTSAWDDFWGRMSPKLLGWIIIAILGLLVLIIYAICILCLRKCFVFLRSRISRPNRSPNPLDYSRALPQEPVEFTSIPLEGLDINQPVNLYEVVPVMPAVPVAQQASSVPLSSV